MDNVINSISTSEILDKLGNGEHLIINEWELFMSYTGTFWIRRDLTKKELVEFDEDEGWHQEYYETLEQALIKIGYVVQSQISIF